MKRDQQQAIAWHEIDPFLAEHRRRQEQWEVARQRRADQLFTLGPEHAELPEIHYDEYLAHRHEIDHGLVDLFADRLEEANRDFAARKADAQFKVRVSERLGEPVDDRTRQMAEAESAQPAVDRLVQAISHSRRAANFAAANNRHGYEASDDPDPRFGPWSG